MKLCTSRAIRPVRLLPFTQLTAPTAAPNASVTVRGTFAEARWRMSSKAARACLLGRERLLAVLRQEVGGNTPSAEEPGHPSAQCGRMKVVPVLGSASVRSGDRAMQTRRVGPGEAHGTAAEGFIGGKQQTTNPQSPSTRIEHLAGSRDGTSSASSIT